MLFKGFIILFIFYLYFFFIIYIYINKKNENCRSKNFTKYDVKSKKGKKLVKQYLQSYLRTTGGMRKWMDFSNTPELEDNTSVNPLPPIISPFNIPRLGIHKEMIFLKDHYEDDVVIV